MIAVMRFTLIQNTSRSQLGRSIEVIKPRLRALLYMTAQRILNALPAPAEDALQRRIDDIAPDCLQLDDQLQDQMRRTDQRICANHIQHP